jgi:hypothetical protein
MPVDWSLKIVISAKIYDIFDKIAKIMRKINKKTRHPLKWEPGSEKFLG